MRLACTIPAVLAALLAWPLANGVAPAAPAMDEAAPPLVATALDGQVFDLSKLRGKVVLIDCWADWRSPCMGKVDEVKALYERRRGEGFEVIGVSLNIDRGRAEQLVKTLALPWPQLFVPGDDRTRRLWSEGPGIASPHLLLIDREGILRWFGGDEGLKERINALIDAPSVGK